MRTGSADPGRAAPRPGEAHQGARSWGAKLAAAFSLWKALADGRTSAADSDTPQVSTAGATLGRHRRAAGRGAGVARERGLVSFNPRQPAAKHTHQIWRRRIIPRSHHARTPRRYPSVGCSVRRRPRRSDLSGGVHRGQSCSLADRVGSSATQRDPENRPRLARTHWAQLHALLHARACPLGWSRVAGRAASRHVRTPEGVETTSGWARWTLATHLSNPSQALRNLLAQG